MPRKTVLKPEPEPVVSPVEAPRRKSTEIQALIQQENERHRQAMELAETEYKQRLTDLLAQRREAEDCEARRVDAHEGPDR